MPSRNSLSFAATSIANDVSLLEQSNSAISLTSKQANSSISIVNDVPEASDESFIGNDCRDTDDNIEPDRSLL